VPVDRLPGLPDPQSIQFWTGPGAHLLHYPIGPTGDSVNFLAVVEGPQAWARNGGWVDEIAADEPQRAFDGWHPAATAMIGAVTHAVRWGLFAVRPLPLWYRGRARALARLPQEIAWIHEHDVQAALRRRTERPAWSQPAPTA
jgi:salicylate hydroxylase